jgi:V8-like Glu-specific endopeptidase
MITYGGFMTILVAAILSLFSSVVWSIPVAPFDALDPAVLKSTINKAAAAYDFEGIVKLSNCSGALVIFHGMPFSAKAVVMTNGHCIQKPGGYLNPGEVWTNKPISRAMKLYDKQMKLHPIQATKILYATMTNTDLAFYELDKSYLQITKETFVRPLILDSLRPSLGQPIEIISGYWDRGYSCAIDDFIFQVKEGEWIWTDSIRYTAGCDTIGGTSGSPLIAKGEKRVVGINNTSNEAGGRCTLNNPCEVNANGEIHHQKGMRYGQQTYNVYSCLTPDFQINLSIPYCDLPR